MLLWCSSDGGLSEGVRNGGGRGVYQPASRERAADLRQGVSIHGFWIGSLIEPIVSVAVLDID